MREGQYLRCFTGGSVRMSSVPDSAKQRKQNMFVECDLNRNMLVGILES